MFNSLESQKKSIPVLNFVLEFCIYNIGSEFAVRWCTGHCPVRQTKAAFGCLLLFYFNPFLDFLLVCVEPLAPVEYII